VPPLVAKTLTTEEDSLWDACRTPESADELIKMVMLVYMQEIL
jgi:hypothetical protein